MSGWDSDDEKYTFHENEPEITFNAWAHDTLEKPIIPPRAPKQHLNPTPQIDPLDDLYREELIHQVLTLKQILQASLVKVYHAQASHRNQVRDNRTLKEYVANLLEATKKLDGSRPGFGMR